ncbi:MAG TPA: non-ribosomal peptide synthetase, partial [Rhodobacterales bacterium]|nr:non-ribosomal peptide synthetase [Rhodobacterales bacterium]
LVLAPDGALAPFGAEGELWIAGPAVAEGYLGRDDLTAERFRPAPDWVGGGRMYRPGDLVRWRADGALDYLGRVDRQVKLRGFRLEPEGIEKQIEAVDGVAHAVVAVDGGGADGGDGAAEPRLLAWVSLDAGADLATVKARVQAVLPAFARPQVVAVEDWPKTPGGKIDLRRLPRPGAASPTPHEAGAVVDDDTRAVMAAFRKVLKARHVGPDQSFFDLGGHSILMLRLIARLEGQMGLRTNVATVAAHPTPRRLAKALRAGKVVLDPSVVVPIQPEGTRAPIYGIHVIGENGSFFRPLAEALGPDQPLFGLSVGQLSDSTPTRIEDTARFYLEQIQKHRPEGPLVLLSVSLGSYVAFELAQQLRAAGRDVRLLGLFDATGPAGRAHKTGLARLGLHARRLRKGGFGYLRGWMVRKTGDLRHKLQLARRRRREARGGEAAPALSIGQFVAANDLARQAYTPAPYAGAITVFRADENVFDSEAARESGLGWKPVSAGPFELVDVPGDHLSILTPPNVTSLAAALEGALERVSQA